MKRSEMIRILANDLRDIVQENYIDEKGFEWCANLILLSIEEAEMVPPPYISTALGDVGNFYEVNNWEPENETK